MKTAKDCPFCGEDIGPVVARQGTKYTFYQVMHQPNKKGHRHGLIIMDVDEWNNRPIEDALNARIAELEAENAALKAEISKLKAPQGWIDVKKQMPDVPIALVAWKDGSIKLDSTFTDGGRDYWYHSGLDNVAYWMPLPEPPEVV